MASSTASAVPGAAPVVEEWGKTAPSAGASGTGPGPRSIKQRASLVGMQAAVTVAATREAFRAKPFLSTAVVLSGFSLFFVLISTWNEWYIFSGKDSAGDKVSGGYSLLSFKSCMDIKGGRTEDVPGVVCSFVPILEIAKKYDYFRVAGGTAFAFLLLNLLIGIPVVYITYLRRTGEGYHLPECMATLRTPLSTAIANWVMALFSLIAFAVYAGHVNANVNKDTLAAALNLATDKSFLYGSGFGCTIVSFLFSSTSGVLIFLYSSEQADVDPNANAAAAGAGFPPGLPAAAGSSDSGSSSSSGGGGVTTSNPLTGVNPNAYVAPDAGGAPALPPHVASYDHHPSTGGDATVTVGGGDSSYAAFSTPQRASNPAGNPWAASSYPAGTTVVTGSSDPVM